MRFDITAVSIICASSACMPALALPCAKEPTLVRRDTSNGAPSIPFNSKYGDNLRALLGPQLYNELQHRIMQKLGQVQQMHVNQRSPLNPREERAHLQLRNRIDRLRRLQRRLHIYDRRSSGGSSPFPDSLANEIMGMLSHHKREVDSILELNARQLGGRGVGMDLDELD
ncbi:hypothetical protein AX15_000273 [Amanita polypyramis BW_CC]|nr:hypothetical protein AX15_000273 [Amanita polypyramis BW_CC]